MDFRIRNLSRIRGFGSSRAGLRAVAENAPQIQAMSKAMAETWWAKMRPYAMQIYALRRRIATILVAVLTGLLFMHVIFGANGMVIYKQKSAEYLSLQKRVAQEQKENELYAQKIQALKTDEKAIEREAREQLRYARPGEYVYVPPPPANAPPPNHSAMK